MSDFHRGAARLELEVAEKGALLGEASGASQMQPRSVLLESERGMVTSIGLGWTEVPMKALCTFRWDCNLDI